MLDRRQFIKTAAALTAASLTGTGHRLLGAGEQAPVTYRVRRGDTLSGIARQFGISTDLLRARNGLQGDRILAGQLLLITPPSAPALTYVVKSGDTLGGIAKRHNTTVRAIQNHNNLSGDRIFPGQQLEIPAGAAAGYSYIGNVVNVTRGLSNLRKWQYIVGHHSGIENGNAAIYDRFHRERMRMPNGLAYHFVIGNGRDSGNGEIEIGDRWKKQLQGGHVSNHHVNDVGIGICVVGNFEKRKPGARQIAAFTELVHYLKNDLLGGRPNFTVHREVDGSQTLCPGRHFPVAQMHRLFP